MASLLKRVKDQKSARVKNENLHLIVRLGADRIVRDAYFNGLVFAAVANDDQVDAAEQKRLAALGGALEFSAEDIQKTIQNLTRLNDEAKMEMVEECVKQFTNADVAEIFLKEFEEIWTLGGGDKNEFDEFKKQLVDWMGDTIRVALEKRAKDAAEAERKRLAEAEEKRRKAEEEKKNRQYNTLRALAHKYVVMLLEGKGNRKSFEFTLCGKESDFLRKNVESLREDFIEASLAGLDVQNMFKQIASHFVFDMENLNDEDQVSLARDTVWMLIALSTERVALDKIIAFDSKIAFDFQLVLGFIFNDFGFAYYKKSVSLSIFQTSEKMRLSSVSEKVANAWVGCRNPGQGNDKARMSEESFIMSSAFEDGIWICPIELWFCKMTGAKPVYMDLFSLTPEQVTKLNEWRSLRKGYSKERLADYAHSIGINQAFGWDMIEHLLDKKTGKKS